MKNKMMQTLLNLYLQEKKRIIEALLDLYFKAKTSLTLKILLESIGIDLLNMFIFLVVFIIIIFIFKDDNKDENYSDN
jgi:hypothetical protein